MASTSAFTEEGRTRIRNFQRRVSSYLIVWMLIGVAIAVACVYLRTRYGYRPLQRLYLSQYIKASIKSSLPLKKPSKYTVLVRVIPDSRTGKDLVFGCTDDQVMPLRDETGPVKLDLRMNREYEAGDLLRGIRILKAKEYAREVKRRDTGIGIPALRPRRA